MATDFNPGPGHEINHSDIYMRLGELSGGISALTSLVQDKRDDITRLTVRVNNVESKVAGGVALAVAVSFLIPSVISVVAWLNPADPQGKAQQLAQQKEEIHQLRQLLQNERVEQGREDQK